MTKRMLDYCLKETAEAVRIMARDKSPLHMFDYGIAPDGTKYVFVLAVVTEHVANNIMPSDQMRPTPGTANAKSGAEPGAPEAKE